MEGMATHSNILAWRIPWTGEPDGYNPLGCKELDTTEVTYYTSLHVVAVFSLLGILDALLGTEEGN